MYLYGWNVERDPTEADKWFQKALRKGHTRLLADLGDYTREGWLGHDRIKTRALAWYLAAAHFGIVRAPGPHWRCRSIFRHRQPVPPRLHPKSWLRN